jgi:hypothetical protein
MKALKECLPILVFAATHGFQNAEASSKKIRRALGLGIANAS